MAEAEKELFAPEIVSEDLDLEQVPLEKLPL